MSSTIKISNVPLWVSELHLKQHFQCFGKIISSSLIVDNNGRSTGKAEIMFANSQNAKNAVRSIDKSRLDGAKIHIELVSLETEAIAE